MNKKLILIISIVVVAGFYLFVIRRGQDSTKNEVLKNAQVAQQATSARRLFDLAKSQEKDNELLLSKNTYQKILDNYPNYSKIADIQRAIENLNMNIIFSPSLITDQSKYYEVKPGDSLIKIARKFNTTVEAIMKINMLKSKVIRPQMRLKIWVGKFSLLVDKSQNILMLKSNEEIIKTYSVSTGKNNSTPVGTFKIKNKLIDPPWKGIPPDDPRNILGSRWMGFDLEGYGIHGTTEPKTIGKQITDGCVRMMNNDVEKLYSILPKDTEVTIID